MYYVHFTRVVINIIPFAQCCRAVRNCMKQIKAVMYYILE